MGELTLLCGPADIELHLELCTERLQTGRGATLFYLLPSRIQARRLRHRLALASPVAAFQLPYVFGLDDFVRALYRMAPDRRAFLPDGAAHLLVADALEERAREAVYFRASGRQLFAGLTRELTRFFAELRQAGLSVDVFAAQCADLPELSGAKGEDLAAAYRIYQKRLDPHWIDRTGVLHVLIAHLDAENLARHFPGVDLLLVSGFATFPAPLAQLLDRLFDLLPQSRVALDFSPEHDADFERAAHTYALLSARAARCETAVAPPTGKMQRAADLPTSPHACIDLIPCARRLDEVEEIARRIKDLHGKRGVALEDICLSFRNMETYAPLVAEVFVRYGLPYTPRHYQLARTPVAVALLAVLDTVLERYARSGLLRLLGLPYVEFRGGGEHGRRLTAADLDTWTRTLQPAVGRAGWLWQIDLRCEQLQREIDRLQEGYLVADEADHPERSAHHLSLELDQLLQLRENLQALFAVLAPLERNMTLPAFCDALRAISRRLRLAQNLAPSSRDREQIETTARDGSAFALLDQLLDQLAILAPCLRKEKFAPRDLNDALRAAIASSSCETPHARDAGVLLIEPHQLHGTTCDYLFLGGLVEGEFPRLPKTDIFLDDRDRRSLGLPHVDDMLATERLLFRRAVNHPRQGLCLLFPQGGGAETLPPSSFVEELLATSPQTKSAGIYTVAHLHAAIGRSLDMELARAARAKSALAPAIPRLLRGIRLMALRSRQDSLSAYDGLLAEAGALESLATRFGRGHAFSVTQLETYARCPFAFFSGRILGAVPLHDPEDDLTALERGNLIHHALYRFYSERRQAVRPDDLAQARAHLRAIVRTEAETMGLTGFFWEREVERLVGRDEAGTREGLLERFLNLEAHELEIAAPALFEYSFGSYPGMGPRDPLSTQTPFTIADADGAEVRIFGKIDRIDRTDGGQFIVLDYKTGHVPGGLEEIRQGLSLQLPIYLLAVEQLLGRDAGLVEGVAGAYYQLRDHENCGKTRLFADQAHKDQVYHTRSRTVEHEQFRQLMERAKDFALRYVDGMRSGRFHVTRHPPERTCSHCPYAQSCRLDPRRMRLLEKANVLP